MRIKYILEKNENNQLVIQEYSALDKKDSTMFTLLCEETYDDAAIQAAIADGKEDLIDALRTSNLYPQGVYAGTIAEMVIAMYGPDGQASMEAICDDNDLLTEQAREREMIEDLDEIIEDDADEFEELLEADDGIKHIKTTIQVADEEVVDIEKNKIDDDLLV